MIDFPGPLADLADLLQRARNKRLSAEARVHSHHQHHVHILQDLAHSRCRCTRINRYTGQKPQLLDLMHHAVKMHTGLGMHRNDACSCGCKLRNIAFRVLNHQMNIKR
ncbi:hypothetical protein D3C75_768790 [compost metagenome]